MSFAPFPNAGGILGRLYGGSTNPLGGLLGGSSNPGGLLGAAALQDAQKRQQMAMAAALLQASGPSPQKIGFGQALGGAMLAGQQAGDQANNQALQAELLKRQLQPKQQGPVQVSRGGTLVDPQTGKVLYSSEESGRPQLGQIDPDNYTIESLAKYQQSGNIADLAPRGSGQNIGNFNPGDYTPGSFARFMKTGDPVDLQRYVTPATPSIQVINGVPTVVTPDRTGGAPRQAPLTDLGTEASAQARLASEKASATATGEAQGAAASKAPAVASMDYVLRQFEQLLPTTPQGGVLGIGGKIGGVTNYKDAARFDNLREQLSTELRTVYRIPGEGTLSNQEQAQYGLQLPDRNNPREVNEAILRDLRERTRLRTQTPIGFGPAQPSAPQAPTPQSGGGDINSLLDKYAPKNR